MATNPRTIVFIDGENLVIRYEKGISSGEWSPRSHVLHMPGKFLWHERMVQIQRSRPFRVIYYSTAIGAEETLEETRRQISGVKFNIVGGFGDTESSICPRIFKKEEKRAKTKSVDINLTTDLLSAAYSNEIDRAIVISGDGDYIPVYEEVMRCGKQMVVGALSEGLNPLVPPRVDFFENLDPIFWDRKQS